MTRRVGRVERVTTETSIRLELELDGAGVLEGKSGIGFFDHMLTLWARHGGFSLKLEAQGDLEVDDHHTVEDVGICLGRAFREALGDKKGIARYASLALPMDEALVLCAIDISGRAGFYPRVDLPAAKIGNFDSQLVLEFWRAFVAEAAITVHVRQLAGQNTHHVAEAIFKGMGQVMKRAVSIEGRELPSTKGVL